MLVLVLGLGLVLAYVEVAFPYVLLTGAIAIICADVGPELALSSGQIR